MNYVGIDYHKKYSVVTAVNKEGHVLRTCRLDNKSEQFHDFLTSLGGPCKAVVETSRTWGTLYDMLEEIECVEDVSLAHSLKVRAIAEAKIKTDKIDSHILAQLLRVNLIPAAYIPAKETRTFKEMIRQRVFLVRMRTRLKNRIHVLLDRRHIALPAISDIFGRQGTEYLKKVNLPGVDGLILKENLALLDHFNDLIKEAEREIQRLIGSDPRVNLLKTIPGFGATLAAVVALEIDDISRFSSAPKLASYTGLVPSTYASGGKIFHGRLLRMSNKWLKWAFVEAAWVAMRSSPYCKMFYESRKRNKGSHTAIIALARRISEIVWHVLSENREYQERPFRAFKKTTGKEISPAALTIT